LALAEGGQTAAKEQPVTDHQLLSVLVALGILVNLYCVLLVREVHLTTNKTLLLAQVSLDTVSELLNEFKASRKP